MLPQNGISLDLKCLLSKWKLDCILSHLLAEKVDVEVFAMMKASHIGLLIQNFPLGIQIRFEYYLEQWREEIGKPFQLSTANDVAANSLFQQRKTKPETATKSTQTDLIVYNASAVAASQTTTKVSNDAIGAIPSTETPLKMDTTAKQVSIDLSGTSKPPSPADEVDLLAILRSASCGIRLITSYGLRQSFTDKERKLLIETIVDHYIDNNMKFNVQISYALEQAVLRMFPSEKLSYYRAAKLGRIYITYVNFRAKERAKEQEQKNTENSANVISGNNNVLANENSNEIFQITDEHIMIRTASTQEIDMSDVSQVSAANDESGMSDNTESIVFTIENTDEDGGNEGTENKIISDEVDLTAALDSAIIIRKVLSNKRQRIEEVDGPFISFSIPWDMVPHDIISLLENGQQLGKYLNIFANFIVDELRKISNKVPVRVLRAVSQQAVIKYPHSFLDKDAEGNLKPATTSNLLSRLRNRNAFLNRQHQ